MNEIYLIIFAIFGLCFGSFANVLIYRLPKDESINFPASHCQTCNTPLKWYHNIPLFSWLALRGKCAFCKSKISIQYPLVELFSAALMVFSFCFEADIIKAFFLGILFIILFALSIIDLRYKAVPSSLLYVSIVLSIIYSFSIDGIIWGCVFAFVFWLLRFLVSFFMKREAMGEADIYIAFVIGAVLGWKLGMIAIYIGAIATLPVYVIVSKKGYELAFVPFLAFGLFVAYAFENYILSFLKYLYG